MNSDNTLGPLIAMLLVALLLQLFPISGGWLHLKPNFFLLIMIAWMLYFPERYGMEFAVLTGIIADLVLGSVIGYHVLIFSISGLILIFFHRVVVYLQLIQRVILVFMLVILVAFMEAVMNSLFDKPLFLDGVFWLGIISALCWIPLDKLVSQFYLHQN
jgi:rod shape-determining protein MreD